MGMRLEGRSTQNVILVLKEMRSRTKQWHQKKKETFDNTTQSQWEKVAVTQRQRLKKSRITPRGEKDAMEAVLRKVKRKKKIKTNQPAKKIDEGEVPAELASEAEEKEHGEPSVCGLGQ